MITADRCGVYVTLVSLLCPMFQVACQTGDELEDNGTQTDDVKTVEKWVQWPPEDLRGYGT